MSRFGSSAWLKVLMRGHDARLAAGMVLVGALAFLVLGETPSKLDREQLPDATWVLETPVAADLAVARATFAASPLWASEPAPVAAPDAAPPPPPPPPRLIGIVRIGAESAGNALGIFLFPDGRRERAAVGAKLLDGSIVESLVATRASLRMADGREVELRLLDGSASGSP